MPGTTGAVDSARQFAREWCDAHGLTSRLVMAERIYRLERVVPPVGVSGRARVATEARSGPPDRMGRRLHRRSARTTRVPTRPRHSSTGRSGRARGPGTSGRTASRCPWRPPAARPRTGSGSARSTRHPSCADAGTPARSRPTPARPSSTADAGSSSCSPTSATQTSNKIYQQIGYEPVIDVDQIAFDAPAG